MEKKQIIRVLEAVTQGCNTSSDVSDETGLSIKKCSSYLSELSQDGLIKKTDRTISLNDRGPPNYIYEPLLEVE